MQQCSSIDISNVDRYIRNQGRFLGPPPRLGSDRRALIAGIPPACEIGRKTMSVKHASDLATRLSITAGATLAATFLVALALTTSVF